MFTNASGKVSIGFTNITGCIMHYYYCNYYYYIIIIIIIVIIKTVCVCTHTDACANDVRNYTQVRMIAQNRGKKWPAKPNIVASPSNAF